MSGEGTMSIAKTANRNRLGGSVAPCGAASPPRLWPAVVLLLATVALAAPARGEPPWEVGLAKADITPEKPVRMKGYGGRTEPSTGVLDRLFAKAMAIRGDGGGLGLLVTADLCVMRRPLARSVATRIMEATDLERKQILLNVSHTHASPLVGMSEWYRYDLSETQRKRLRSYTERFEKTVAAIAEKAVDRMGPARLRHGEGVASFVMNRREFTGGGVRLGVNPRGYADRAVPVLRVEKGGELRGLIFGVASHPTTLTGANRKLSGDYAGIAQHAVEKRREGVQAMFVAGCGGSANPYPRGSVKWARKHGKTLADEVLRVADSGDLSAVHGPLRVRLDKADLPLKPVPSRKRLKRMANGPHHRRFNARRMLKALDAGEPLPEVYTAPVAVWQFGEDLTLVGLPGEVVGEYVPRLEATIGHRNLWPAAYCNDVFGYLPTARVIEEGGYETKGLIVEIGFFAKEAETVLLDTVERLARDAGRPSLTP